MKLLRRIHLYLGCFFAPLLLFYIVSGGYQTVNHDRLKSPSEAETLLQKMRTVHVDQIYPSNNEFQKPSKPLYFQIFVMIMVVAATTTILIGIILAFKTLRDKWPVWISLILGFLLPALVLWMAQGR